MPYLRLRKTNVYHRMNARWFSLSDLRHGISMDISSSLALMFKSLVTSTNINPGYG